uniref:Acetylcholinesterase-1 n=1 Tax=Trittame loki TaxID=1295018 RepID=ACES_TRILK|nr:RecName: Full=Acetylcholinesterase-1; Short=AChE; Flags: Precursor [Trittame loki]
MMLPRCFVTVLLMSSVLYIGGETSSEVLGPVVSTEAGSFQGMELTTHGERVIYAFLGIPYAKPPTGLLRFKKPQPADFIQGTYKATEKPPSCFQLDSDLQLPWADPDSPMKEDCLFLNLWTPASLSTEEEELKSVMVWIHGGGYTSGSSALDVYDGQTLSSSGDVVVVTMNYRLDAFGFLNSLTEDAPGNMALYDQLLALQWVHTNIKYFGGDPNKVTLFGESVGAFATSFLALSPLTKGLFQKIMLESGSAYNKLTVNSIDQAKNNNQLATLVGCANETFTLISNPEEVVACMREVAPAKFTQTYYKELGSEREKINFIFWPHFGDDILPTRTAELIKEKNLTALFAGVNSVEGSALSVFFFPEVYQMFVESNLTLTKAYATILMNEFFKVFNFQDSAKAIEFYLGDVEDDDEEGIRSALFGVVGDYIITCPTIYLADKYSERGANVQFYRFDRRPSTSQWPPEWMGAAHNDEIQFVFGMPVRYPEKYTEEERTLSEYMTRTWTNFVKSEDLKLKNGSQWPSYSLSEPQFATLQTNEQIIGSGQRKAECDFWRPYFDI